MTSVVYDLNSSSFPDLNEDLSPNLSSASLSDYLPNFDHQINATQYISSESTRLIVSEPNYNKPPSFSYSSSSFEFHQAAPKNERSREELFAGNHYCRAGIEGSSSAAAAAESWIPSKMRITQKMSETTDKPLKYTLRFHPNNSNYNDNSSNSSIRVCSDCNTTTTPLWRSGPKGPKSLCNACGIRQRKARRALAAAGMGNSSSTSMGVETYSCPKSSTNKEKKLRAGHFTQCKKSPKISLKNFGFSLGNNNINGSSSVFPLAQDVEQAAILLMELSCGLLHHAS